VRLLVVVPWDQDWGGVASVVGNLATYLTRQSDHVMFLNPSNENAVCEKKTRWGFRGFTMCLRPPMDAAGSPRSVASFLGFFPFTLIRIMRLLVAEKIDIVNIHYPGDAGIYFAVACLLLGRKLVISVHGADFFPEGKPKQMSFAMRCLLAAAHAVVAPSQAFVEDVVRFAPQVKSKSWAIHNGVNLAEFAHETSSVEQGREYVLCIAHQSEKKAIEVLISAFSFIKNEFPSIDLVLVGEGPTRPLLEQMTAQLGLGERVRFVGWKTRTEIAVLLKGCRAFALPSRSEPFGIVITEAMACSKPVVATRVGGIPEIIEHERNGLLVTPDNPQELAGALKRILADGAAATTLGQRGYETVCARFTVDHTGQTYKRLFERLLNTIGESNGSVGAVYDSAIHG